MAKVKGVVYDAMRRVLAQQNEAFKEAYFSCLKPEYVDDIKNTLSISWRELNTDENTNSLPILAKMLYPNDRLALRKIGKLMAHDGMPRFYQIFIRIPSIKFVYSRVSKIWNSFYDKGKLGVEDFHEQGFTLLLRNFPEFPEFLREYLCGYFLGISELLHLKNVTVKKFESDPMAWKWIMRWSK